MKIKKDHTEIKLLRIKLSVVGYYKNINIVFANNTEKYQK